MNTETKTTQNKIPWWRDYLKIGQPVMAFFLTITAVAGFTLAQTTNLDWFALGILIVGAFGSAYGAKVLNHVAEVPYDAKMKRTQDRPLPAGRIPVSRARWIGWITGLGSSALMLYYLPLMAGVMALATIFVYVFIYTPLKRVSTLNTVVGALPGAFPILGGWFAGGGVFDEKALGLTMIMFLWQFPHFLAIAFLCKEDYALAGFKMLPLVDPSGKMTGRQILIYSFALALVALSPTVLYQLTGTIYLTVASILGVGNMYFAFRFYQSPERKTALNILKFAYLQLTVLMIFLMVDQVVI